MAPWNARSSASNVPPLDAMNPSRPLSNPNSRQTPNSVVIPQGECGFKDIPTGNQCGCKRFTLAEPGDLGHAIQSQMHCVCQHHSCFHSERSTAMGWDATMVMDSQTREADIGTLGPNHRHTDARTAYGYGSWQASNAFATFEPPGPSVYGQRRGPGQAQTGTPSRALAGSRPWQSMARNSDMRKSTNMNHQSELHAAQQNALPAVPGSQGFRQSQLSPGTGLPKIPSDCLLTESYVRPGNSGIGNGGSSQSPNSSFMFPGSGRPWNMSMAKHQQAGSSVASTLLGDSGISASKPQTLGQIWEHGRAENGQAATSVANDTVEMGTDDFRNAQSPFDLQPLRTQSPPHSHGGTSVGCSPSKEFSKQVREHNAQKAKAAIAPHTVSKAVGLGIETPKSDNPPEGSSGNAKSSAGAISDLQQIEYHRSKAYNISGQVLQLISHKNAVEPGLSSQTRNAPDPSDEATQTIPLLGELCVKLTEHLEHLRRAHADYPSVQGQLAALADRVDHLTNVSHSFVSVNINEQQIDDRFESLEVRMLEFEEFQREMQKVHDELSDEDDEFGPKNQRRLMSEYDERISSLETALPSEENPREIEVVFLPFSRELHHIWYDSEDPKVGKGEDLEKEMFSSSPAPNGLMIKEPPNTQSVSRPSHPSKELWCDTIEWARLRASTYFSQLSKHGSSSSWSGLNLEEWADVSSDATAVSWLSPVAPSRIIFERLQSRGLVQTVTLTNSSASHIRSSIHRAFAAHLYEPSPLPAGPQYDDFAGLSAPFIPLRKKRSSDRLRFLSPEEMKTSALWDMQFFSEMIWQSGGHSYIYVTNRDAYMQSFRKEFSWTWQQMKRLPSVEYRQHMRSAHNAPPLSKDKDPWQHFPHLDGVPSVPAGESQPKSVDGSRSVRRRRKLPWTIKASKDAELQQFSRPLSARPLSRSSNGHNLGPSSAPELPTKRMTKRSRMPSVLDLVSTADAGPSSTRRPVLQPKRQRRSRASTTSGEHAIAGAQAFGVTPQQSKFSSSAVFTSDDATADEAVAQASYVSKRHKKRKATPQAYATPHSGAVTGSSDGPTSGNEGYSSGNEGDLGSSSRDMSPDAPDSEQAAAISSSPPATTKTTRDHTKGFVNDSDADSDLDSPSWHGVSDSRQAIISESQLEELIADAEGVQDADMEDSFFCMNSSQASNTSQQPNPFGPEAQGMPGSFRDSQKTECDDDDDDDEDEDDNGGGDDSTDDEADTEE